MLGAVWMMYVTWSCSRWVVKRGTNTVWSKIDWPSRQPTFAFLKRNTTETRNAAFVSARMLVRFLHLHHPFMVWCEFGRQTPPHVRCTSAAHRHSDVDYPQPRRWNTHQIKHTLIVIVLLNVYSYYRCLYPVSVQKYPSHRHNPDTQGKHAPTHTNTWRHGHLPMTYEWRHLWTSCLGGSFLVFKTFMRRLSVSLFYLDDWTKGLSDATCHDNVIYE